MEKITLLSLANDLKRIVQSIQRNSNTTAARFNREAQKRLVEAKKTSNPSVTKLLVRVEESLKQKNDLKKAEDCLMYSVLLTNRAISLN